MKALLATVLFLPAVLCAEAIETQKYTQGGLEADIPVGFTYVDLSDENTDAAARGYFESSDKDVRFYHERARPTKLFYDSKFEAITSAQVKVVQEYGEAGDAGVAIENYLTVAPFDKGAGSYTRYLVLMPTSQSAGGVTQIGIQTNSQAAYDQWKPYYLKFRETVMADEGH
jgi:hypothetical protein